MARVPSASNSSTADANESVLSRRYGAPPDARRRRRTLWLLGSVLALLAGAFLTWVIVDELSSPSVSTQDVDFDVAADQRSVDVIFDITMPPGTEADCTVEAVDANFGQVGLLDVRLGPFESQVNRVTITVATSADPVLGKVDSCEVVG